MPHLPHSLKLGLLLALLVVGCGSGEKKGPPNTFMEGTIAEVEKETETWKLLNSSFTVYSIKFAVPEHPVLGMGGLPT